MGFSLAIALDFKLSFELPPSIIYDAKVQGDPAKPIIALLPLISSEISFIASGVLFCLLELYELIFFRSLLCDKSKSTFTPPFSFS